VVLDAVPGATRRSRAAKYRVAGSYFVLVYDLGLPSAAV